MIKLDEAYDYLANLYVEMVKDALQNESNDDEEDSKEDTLKIENKEEK